MNENLAHMQYLPGDPRLVDQLVYELKSKGIFDQFRKECIADVDTRPAYQNLRQRVETSVATFLSRQVWKPDLNKNQLREKLRKHLLDGNYLEQGVERIVDQVVNPKVASVFIPQVEDVVYNYLGIPRKKKVETETSDKNDDLLPTDLEAVSPGSVKSNDGKSEAMDTSESQEDNKMEISDDQNKLDIKEDSVTYVEVMDKDKTDGDSRMSIGSEIICQDSNISIDKSNIPLPEEIKLENIPEPENSPPKIDIKDIDLEKIDLPKEPNPSTDIPLPDEVPKLEDTYYSKETIISTVISSDIPLPDEMPRVEKSDYFKPMILNSEDDDSSSNSSLRRNMSPLTPIRSFNNENSCDAQQAFDNDSDGKSNDAKEPCSFRFTIESKSSENSCDAQPEKKEEQALSYQFDNQVNINTYNTPLYEDSSNSNNLQIDYESDANSKATTTTELKAPETENSVDSKKDKKSDDKKSSSHKSSSSRSRDSHRHSSSKDKKSESKQSSRDSSRHEKKPSSSSSKDDKSKSSKDKEKTSDKSDKKDSRESSKHRSSSSHKSSSHKESSSSNRDSSSKHKSSSSRHSSSSKHDGKKSSSSSHRDKDKEKSSSASDKSKDRSKDSKSTSHRSEKDKDRKSSSSSSSKNKHDDKENKEKKEKKDTDDHYSVSGRGNHTRRSTDRDSNDGSSSSKGSHNPSNTKTSESKKETKTSSKSGHTSNTDSTSPSDKEVVPGNKTESKTATQTKPIVRVDTHLEHPIMSPPRLPFVPDVTLKKPKFAANFEEAKRMMKMRKFLEDEQKRMNQEAALLLEFQANVRPSLSQVYSSIPGPELEFACGSNCAKPVQTQSVTLDSDTTQNVEVISEIVDEHSAKVKEQEVIVEEPQDSIAETLTAMDLEHNDADNSQANIDQSLENNESVNTESKDTILATLTNDDEEKCEVTLTESDLELNQVVLIEAKPNDIESNDETKDTEYFEVTIITEELSDSQDANNAEKTENDDENPLLYFAEHEKYNAEIERDSFSKFYKGFQEKTQNNKMYLINCDTYEENLIREVAENFGKFEIVNYHKNGHLKLPKPNKNIVKNVNIADEVTLPTKNNNFDSPTRYVSPIFSPVKSECSFELSSDYDAKLEEMVNKTSRQEIMEIILGGGVEESASEMPTIDYCMESSIEPENYLKRKINEIESAENNNGNILTANKIRKLSESDLITSTTEESEELPNSRVVTKSKYLGKARRVGLSRPKKTVLPNSPSSDKSVENYDITTPNGKIKTIRSKVQRYDTSDLYKPKLHYLSRRNNVT